MKNFLINILFILTISSISFSQIKPDIKPLSFNIEYTNTKNDIQYQNKTIHSFFSDNNYISQIHVNLEEINKYKLQIKINDFGEEDRLFIIDRFNKNYIGPYTYEELVEGYFYTDVINTKNITIELNSDNKIINKEVSFTIKTYDGIPDITPKTITSRHRDEPTIIVTGFWPPTNEMIRHFSQSSTLNPEGWQGDNWENRGYDIVSFFPSFNPPNCSNCGQGYGDFEVDYQDTSEDFWTIFNEINPIAVITFSRGYIDLSWEMEFNAYNRVNWINDYTTPFLPTPNPPDQDEDAYFLRNSNLPMGDILQAIDNLNIGLTPYIDADGDPGHYVSEFMAYHGTWYRDLNEFGDENCISAGHIHVGGNIDWDTATLATEESIRVLINHLDQFIYTPGDVNQDEIIDILDLVLIMNNILGANELTQIQTYASDINEDGIINIQDIIIIINIILNNF